MTGVVKYTWLDDADLSNSAVVKNIKKPLRINSQFPEVNLETLSGEKMSSSQFENKFIVINWWATWCAPCIKEIPGLNELVDKYENHKNVKFIAITTDPKTKIEDFLKNRNFKYEKTFANSEVRELFGNSYPVNLIIDPGGAVTFLQEGAGNQTPSQVEASLKQQLINR